MPSSWKMYHAWIDEIPDSKLEGGIGSGSIYKDENFRLDMQGFTTAKDGEPQKFNIQMHCCGSPHHCDGALHGCGDQV